MTYRTKCLVVLAALASTACARQNMPRAGEAPSSTEPRIGGVPGKENAGYANGSTSTAQMTDDASLIKDLHALHTLEMHAGMMAQARAQHPQVRDLGSRILREHQEGDRRLTTLAERWNLTLEKMPVSGSDMPHGGPGSGMHKPGSGGMQRGMAMEDAPEWVRGAMQSHMRLRMLSGSEFDLAFIQQMILDHDAALQFTDEALRRVQDDSVKTELQQSALSVRAHRDQARALLATLQADVERKNIRGTEPK